jgi:flagellar motility protein MotE (MotC chaperone)
MRWMLVIAVMLKVLALGAWWHMSLAEARPEAAAAASSGAASGAAEAGVPEDLFTRTRGFRELLEATRKRGEDLDRREQELATRERTLKTLEQTLGGGTESVAVPLAPTTDAGGKPCAVAVTKVYQGMKAEEAAPILEKLDDETARTIFACMGEKQIGAIFAAMSRDRAVALTQILADGS